MNRNTFGSWGIELSDEAFAPLIAIFGVLRFTYPEFPSLNRVESEINSYVKETESVILIRWSPGAFINNVHDVQKYQGSDSPQAIIDVWRKFVEKKSRHEKRIRFEISLESFWREFEQEFDVFWIIEQLSRLSVKADAIFISRPESVSKPIWDYPLRIGFLNDTKSNQLRAELEVLRFKRQPLVGTHIRFIDVSQSGQNCDLLVLPHSLRDSLTALLQSPNALQAACVLVLGEVEDSRERSVPIIEVLRTQARAEGVGLIQISPDKGKRKELNHRQIWFKDFVRELSHNQPIDVSLFHASRKSKANMPLLFATRYLVESSRITHRIAQYAERLEHPDWKQVKIKVSREAKKLLAHNTGQWKSSYTVGELAQGLRREEHRSFRFDRENDTATGFSELKDNVENRLPNAPPPEPKPRWIQTEVWEIGEGERTFEQRRDAFKHGSLSTNYLYQVTVFIGAPSEHSVSPVEPFPEKDLPPNINEHELTVIFTESQLSPAPQRAKITLPRTGNSSACNFYFRVPEKVEEISARIIIAYKNRILQTVLLEAPVNSPGEGIQVLIESIINPGLENLTQQKWFDAALLVNHGVTGRAELTRLVDDNAELVGIAGIEDTIKWFRDKITYVAHNREKFKTLKGKASVDLLRSCAIKGGILYDSIMNGRDAGSLSKGERIELVTARLGEDFPVEFVYGRAIPDSDETPLCPNAEVSLRDGHCSGNCPVGADAGTVICPLGFWGLNRVIERHVYDVRALRELGAANWALQSRVLDGRDRLNIFDAALVAASNNVDPKKEGTLDEVIKELKTVAGIETTPVQSWEDWLQGIKSASPSLIVLLPHTFADAEGDQVMEIAADKRLMIGRLKPEHLLGPKKVPKPLVILMGCKTAAAEIPYQKLIIAFRDKGAALVLGTGATVFGPHAAAVTKKLINALAAVKSEDVTFGDILLKVRRQLLAEGLMIVLCLTSYGDSDWLISGVREKGNV